MTTTYTTHLQYPKPDFLTSPWHQGIHDMINRVDASIHALMLLCDVDIYAVATVYVIGNLAYDTTLDKSYVCNVNHTSHAANSFATERAAHPTYWTAIV